MKIKFKKHKKIIMLGIVAIALISVSGVFALNGYFGGGATIPEDTMTRGLVLAYNFDEGSGQTAYNAAATGRVNDGTLGSGVGADSSDPKWVADGGATALGGRTAQSGGALQFDGKNDYVDCGNDPSLNITDAITIEAWVKTTASKISRVISNQPSGINDGYFIQQLNDNIRFCVYKSDVLNVSGSSSAVITDGLFHHIVGVNDGTNLIIYVDGVSENSSTDGGTFDSTTANFDIGRYSDNSEFFNGSIDGVKIYNRALSAEEVRYHYNRGGPVSHWKFDEGSGSVAYNYRCPTSVNSNLDGTIYGATGTATAGGNDTLTDSGKAWTTNEWAGETVEITSGTGSGQIRTVSSNTATALTVSAVWANNPDATSVYRVTSKDEWTTGKHKTGLSFDGVDDYVDVGDTSETSVKTISFWLKADDIISRDIIDLNGSDYIEIDANSDITATGFTGVVYIDAVSASTIDTNWHHITVTTDTGQNASDLDIGRRDGGTYFDGVLDDVRIYAYVRGADEIRLDYNAGFAARFGGKTGRGKASTQCSTDPAGCMDYGLVASYDMDEGGGDTLYNAADTDSVNDGVLGSAAGADPSDPTWVGAGGARGSTHLGGARGSTHLQFDGVNDYVNCGNDASLDITDAITIEAWVKHTAYGSDGQIVTKWVASAGNRQFMFKTGSSGTLRLNVRKSDGSASVMHEGTTEIPLDTWYHVVGIFDGSVSSMDLYVNGVKDVATKTSGVPSAIQSTSSNVNIGAYSDGGAERFNGAIDGVRIYNRALSAEEVRYHYNRGGPVAYWGFDEGSGQKAYDSVGDADARLGSDTSSSGDVNDPSWERP